MNQSFFNQVNGNITCSMLGAIYHFPSIHFYSVRSKFSENHSHSPVPPNAAALVVITTTKVKKAHFGVEK